MRYSKQAFTLIELLIVVAIIGILAAIAVPNFQQAITRSKLSRVRADMKAVQNALESYRTDSSNFPPHHSLPAGNPTDFDRQYRYLTSPIAYLSASPMDLFSERSKNRYGKYQDLPMQPLLIFNYNAGQFYSNHASWYDTSPSVVPSIAFGIYSYGPDRAWDGYFRLYDSSNGLASYGDMAQFGGASGGWYLRAR